MRILCGELDSEQLLRLLSSLTNYKWRKSMIIIEKAILDEKDINELCELSNAWSFEDITR